MSALLALTDSAVEAVKNIVSSSDEVAETSGLRMVADLAGTQANFQLRVVPVPAEGGVNRPLGAGDLVLSAVR